MLGPALRPGQTVVLDNLSAHKAPAVRAAIEAAGCTIAFLPPYSPGLNPVEPAWSKLKTRLRAAAARTAPDREVALAAQVDAVTPADARAHLRHCGYGRSAQP